MKKQLLLLAMILLPLVASAHDIEVKNAGGKTIYYNYINDGTELEVTFRGSSYNDYSNEYQGNVVIPEEVTYMNRTRKVTSIEDRAFYNCSGLTSVTIPNSVTSIGSSTFRGCSGLTSVTIPNSVTSIGSSTFSGCYGLTSVTIPNSVTSIGEYAFRDCSSLTSITIPNSVTSIGEYAFRDCSSLTSVTIPNSVMSIGHYAFYNCYKLTSITIGNSVTSIGSYAFRDCSSLTSVHITDIAAWCKINFFDSYSNPLGYAKHLFMDGKEIIDLVIPNSVTSIGNYAFYNCYKLTSVTIPNSVTSIGEFAFLYCSGLTSVTIPNSVTSIGNYAFQNCSGLTQVTLNSNDIVSKSYSSSSTLGSIFGNQVKEYVLGNDVTSIGSDAFIGCSGLTSVTIPNSVTSIGGYAFRGCSGLTSVTIPNSVTSIGYGAFYECSGLTSVTIPNSVTSIGSSAFRDCSSLTSVTIGSGVTSIGSSAFDGVDIPTVVSLIENPFAITGKTSNSRTFTQNTFLNAALCVPKGAIEKYKATDGWKDFVFMEEGEGPGGDTPEPPIPEPQKCATPTISYENGKLTFDCDTEGATCQYSITDTDIKAGSGNEVQLTATYNISVFAAKSGYENSETATATLCWIDQQPKTEGIANGIANIPANAVLIQSAGGSIKVQGVDDGTQVNVYSTNGTQAGSAISQSGAATINTNLQPGSIAIVKIGQKSVKVAIK